MDKSGFKLRTLLLLVRLRYPDSPFISVFRYIRKTSLVRYPVPVAVSQEMVL